MQTLKVHLSSPISSVKIAGNGPASGECSRDEQGNVTGASQEELESAGLKAEKAELSEVCRIFKTVVENLERFYNETFAEAKGEIAKLSVEIARKVLAQKVQEGDYEIESIVRESLKSAPVRQDVVVHLNPADIERCEKTLREEGAGTSAGVKFVPDANIGRAECLIETPKGIIESLIKEHLEQIGKALIKAE